MSRTTRREMLTRSFGCLAAAPLATAWTSTTNAEQELNQLPQIRGREKKEFRDPEGRVIWQMTDNEWESKHTYYDICPWSRDRQHIVFSSANPKHIQDTYRDGLSTTQAATCIMDVHTSEIRIIARRGFYTAHNGTFAMWHPRKKIVYYRRGPEVIGIVDIETRKHSSMKGVLRQLSPDGTKFVSQLNHYDRPGHPDTWGFYMMNEDGSDRKRFVSIQQVYDITPNRDQFHIQDMTVGNPKWTPDGAHLLLTMWVHPKPAVRRSLYVIRSDGTGLRWLTHFGHHHSWTPDGKAILFNGYLPIRSKDRPGEPRMFLIDFDGSNRRMVIDKRIGSHPCMSPGGTQIADADGDGIYVVHVPEQRVDRVATFRKQFDTSHKGTHPHCVWNPNGKQILYNSAETGHSELYMVDVKT